MCVCVPCLGVTLKRAIACGPSCMLGPLVLLRLDLALGAALSSSDELSSSYTPAKSENVYFDDASAILLVTIYQ